MTCSRHRDVTDCQGRRLDRTGSCAHRPEHCEGTIVGSRSHLSGSVPKRQSSSAAVESSTGPDGPGVGGVRCAVQPILRPIRSPAQKKIYSEILSRNSLKQVVEPFQDVRASRPLGDLFLESYHSGELFQRLETLSETPQ